MIVKYPRMIIKQHEYFINYRYVGDVSGSFVAFLILYVDDLLLIGNYIEFLDSIKGYLNKSFSKKDLGEAAYN